MCLAVPFRTDRECVWVNCGFKLSMCRSRGSWNNGNWLESTILIIKETEKRKDFSTSMLSPWQFEIADFVFFFFFKSISFEVSWFWLWCLGPLLHLSWPQCPLLVKWGEGNPDFLNILSFWGVLKLGPETDWLCNLTSHTSNLWAAGDLCCFAPSETTPKQLKAFQFSKSRAEHFTNC